MRNKKIHFLVILCVAFAFSWIVKEKMMQLNNLKNGECSKDTSQDFSLSGMIMTEMQAANQDPNFEVKTTQLNNNILNHFDIKESDKKILILTLPKSGTHLLKKALTMMGVQELYYTSIDQDPFNPPYIPDSARIIFNHAYPGFDCLKEKDCIKIVLIRDLRDAIVSFAHFISTEHWVPCTPKNVLEKYQDLSLDEQLTEAIYFPDQYLGIKCFAKKVLEWMSDPSIFLLRFEDLVGPNGGGDREIQEKTLSDLSKCLNIEISRAKISFIADHLFGNNEFNFPKEKGTFREGTIGSWRMFFKDYHKAQFKEVMGEALISMGYEVNNNW